MPSLLDTRSIDTIRTLAMDAVQAANSGHPGTPMAMAPVVYTLWQRHLTFDPDAPQWTNRDRFVLSIGHASALLYAMLHLARVKAAEAAEGTPGELSISLGALQRFRQLDSGTPGHPEYGGTAGVETTTGPLGQGAATSVGMAMAERWLAARYNRPEFPLFDYRVYALAGDGCMMEGVTSEAASLAGHLRLSNLCWIYDNNGITIEGETRLAFSDDVAARFRSYHWNVLHVGDANDVEQLSEALARFRETADCPTLIIVDSHIGWGSPHKQDSHTAHGEPLGVEEIRLSKRAYGWPEDAHFLVPDEVVEHLRTGAGARGATANAAWQALFTRYQEAYPDLAAEVGMMRRRELPEGWDGEMPAVSADATGLASRVSSATVLNAMARRVPWLVGGSADLAPSTRTRLTFPLAGDFGATDYGGRNLHFGVREHAMGAILNGLALSGIRAFGSGFLVFSDYARGAIRLSALMKLPVIHVFTHDSIGVGEDGPTHQPVEQLAGLRAIPGLIVLRPADAGEVVEAWRVIMRLTHAPVALVLSRQSLPTIDRTRFGDAAGTARGGYVLADADGAPDVLLLASGSEVSLCLAARDVLAARGVQARVISLPSWELFDQQDAAYREAVLPGAVTARVAVEMAAPMGWERYIGSRGTMIGMTGFGASAPLEALLQTFGFTVERVVEAALVQARAANRAPRQPQARVS